MRITPLSRACVGSDQVLWRLNSAQMLSQTLPSASIHSNTKPRQMLIPTRPASSIPSAPPSAESKYDMRVAEPTVVEVGDEGDRAEDHEFHALGLKLRIPVHSTKPVARPEYTQAWLDEALKSHGDPRLYPPTKLLVLWPRQEYAASKEAKWITPQEWEDGWVYKCVCVCLCVIVIVLLSINTHTHTYIHTANE